jgi:telomere length regulation protein
VWGAPDTLTRLPAAQQAYMTHALALMLQRLGKAGLESAPGLLPALLSGVSARLDSPEDAIRCALTLPDKPCVEHAAHGSSPARASTTLRQQVSVLGCRRQGMRVGQAFSAALDASQAPLFAGMGSLELLPGEAWHPSCLPASRRLPSAAQAPASIQGAAAGAR